MKIQRVNIRLRKLRMCATLIHNSNGWYVRYPDKKGNAVRLKLAATEYNDALKEAKRNLPAGTDWVIA